MKRNINLLQSETDLSTDIFNKAQKEYILQALANLGQRMGIKGDGLAYRSFSFLDLINSSEDEYSLNDYIGYIDYKKDENDDPVAIFGLNNIKTNTDKIIDSLTTKSVNNLLYFDNEFSFTIPISGIEKYCKGTIISNENNILTIIAVGKIIGYDDTDLDNAILLYYKYDTSSNKVIYIAKVHHVYSDNNSSYYILLRLYRDKDEDNNTYINKFNLDIQIFNANILGDLYKNSFRDLFQYSNYENSADMGFAFLRPEFIDIDVLEGTTSYNPDKTNNFDSNSPISIIINNIENTNYFNKSTLKLEYDSNKNEFFCVSENYEDVISLYKNEYHFVNIEEEIYNFNDDISEMYRNMFAYYNEKFYIENRVRFFERILCKLYEELNSDNSNGRLYIPINYVISYICNSNDELNIYYSTDIYVLLTNLEEKYDREAYLSNNRYLIYDYKDIDILKSYKFEVEYNYYLKDIINNVYIKEVYTMPYINDEENWNINGENTKIRAVGKDAGNPNIVLIYSKNKNNELDSYSLLNAVKDKNVILRSGFERKKFLVDNKLFEHLDDKKIYCYAYVPIIDNLNRTALENSIIINICDLECLDDELYKSYYIGSNIITLWYYGYDKKQYQFILVKEDGTDYALPLGATVNISNALSNAKYNMNSQDMIILRANISKLAQETLGTVSLNWGIFKNKSAYEYAPNKEAEDTFKYFNDLNAVIEYTDDLKNISDTVINEKTEKYINDFSNIKTTNILYPKYQINRITRSAETTQVNEILQKALQENEIIEINIDNHDNIIISDELRDVAANILVPNEEIRPIDVVYKTIKDTEENYDEYVFNTNVPTFDFKEIFLRNTNNLNRLNIISLDAQGNPYYAFLGTSYDDPSKSTLHLGTLEKNINLGSNSLINEIDRDNFITHDKLSIDFKNLFMNTTEQFGGNQPYVIEKTIDDIKYKMGKTWIFGKSIDPIITYDKISTLSDTKKTTAIIGDIRNTDFSNIPLKISNIVAGVNKPVYAVCLNTICKNTFNIDMDKYNKIKINVGQNKLFAIKYYGLSYKTPMFFMIVNDKLTKEFDNTDGVISSTDTVDMICCTTATSEDVLDTDVLQIMCKFDKYNYDNGDDVEVIWDAPEIYGAVVESEIPPEEDLGYYWWVGLTNPLIDNSMITAANEEDPNNPFILEEDDNVGWRYIGQTIENSDHGYVVWCYSGFNIPLGINNEDKRTYYLILPLGVVSVDIFGSEQVQKINQNPIEIRGHFYNIYQSLRPEQLYQWSLFYTLE